MAETSGCWRSGGGDDEGGRGVSIVVKVVMGLGDGGRGDGGSGCATSYVSSTLITGTTLGIMAGHLHKIMTKRAPRAAQRSTQLWCRYRLCFRS